MGVESTSCSKCGKILRYNAGLFGNYPQSDGLFSRLCSECANDRREEERHEERLKASKRRDAELEQDRNSRYEDSERRLEEDREEQRRRHEELEQQAEDAAYEAQNPGDYECPCCFFITLRSGASRCPKCQGSISGEYWNKIYEQEAVEEKIAQEKFQEWERLEPFRDAEEAREKWVTAKDEVATNWLLFTGIFLTGILVFGLYRLFYTIPDHYEGAANGFGAFVCICIWGLCLLLSLLGMVAIPIVLLIVVVASISKIPLIARLGEDFIKKFSLLSVDQQDELKAKETEVGRRQKNDAGCLKSIWISGGASIAVTYLALLFLSSPDSLSDEQQTDGVQVIDHPVTKSNMKLSSDTKLERSFSGERYPETRNRNLSFDEVRNWEYSELQYAINEMYARHGLYFGKSELRDQFSKFSWYKADDGLTIEGIEDKFSQIEKDNVLLLGRMRDAKK